jgi:drug/metabolite transporter (DMT)-like permease
MHTSKQIIAVIMGVVGVLLVVRGAWGGVWPVSLQLIAGVLLIVFAGLRWWTLR